MHTAYRIDKEVLLSLIPTLTRIRWRPSVKVTINVAPVLYAFRRLSLSYPAANGYQYVPVGVYSYIPGIGALRCGGAHAAVAERWSITAEVKVSLLLPQVTIGTPATICLSRWVLLSAGPAAVAAAAADRLVERRRWLAAIIRQPGTAKRRRCRACVGGNSNAAGWYDAAGSLWRRVSKRTDLLQCSRWQSHCAGTTGYLGGGTIEEMGPKTFSKNSQWRRRCSVLRQSVPQTGSSDRQTPIADGWKAGTSNN